MDAKHALMATQTPAIDRGRGELYWLTGLVVISLAIHGVAIVAMRSNEHVDPQPKPKARTLMTMTVAPAPTPTPPTVTPAAPEAARTAPRITAKRTARPATVAIAPTPEPRAEPPADFTGVTLTNDAAGAWATPVGNGNAMNGPVGTAGARVTGHSHPGTTGGGETVSEGPRTVGLADLSQPPRAPVLSDKLQRNYPDEARSRGAAGKAVMRLRVMPDGHVRDLIVVAETAGGFGEACKRTLRDSVWSPPLDLQARPVSTLVSYTCTFEVH